MAFPSLHRKVLKSDLHKRILCATSVQAIRDHEEVEGPQNIPKCNLFHDSAKLEVPTNSASSTPACLRGQVPHNHALQKRLRIATFKATNPGNLGSRQMTTAIPFPCCWPLALGP